MLLKAVKGGKIAGYAEWALPVYPQNRPEAVGEEEKGLVAELKDPMKEVIPVKAVHPEWNRDVGLNFYGRCGERQKALPQPNLCEPDLFGIVDGCDLG